MAKRGELMKISEAAKRAAIAIAKECESCEHRTFCKQITNCIEIQQIVQQAIDEANAEKEAGFKEIFKAHMYENIAVHRQQQAEIELLRDALQCVMIASTEKNVVEIAMMATTYPVEHHPLANKDQKDLIIEALTGEEGWDGL